MNEITCINDILEKANSDNQSNAFNLGYSWATSYLVSLFLDNKELFDKLYLERYMLTGLTPKSAYESGVYTGIHNVFSMVEELI